MQMEVAEMARGILFSSMQKLAREVKRQQAQQRREAAKAQIARERAAKQALRQEEVRKKREAAEAKAAYAEERQAEVESLNALNEEYNSEIERILACSLSTDAYFELSSLHREVEHPPFGMSHLEQQSRKPVGPTDPLEPEYIEPKPPKALFGKKKKHEAAIATAKPTHEAARKDWRKQLDYNATLRRKQKEEYENAEKNRLQQLEKAKAKYAEECNEREKEIQEFNSSIDSLITNLSYGSSDAVEAYFNIVFSHTEYPEHFPVSHEVKFDPAIAELAVSISIPPPSELKTVKAYRYEKKSDEIKSTELSQKARKDRYSSAIHQVLLRTFRDVFKADRRGLVKTVSLKLGTEAKNPATGKHGFILLAGVAASRESFLEFDLSAVVPVSTLGYLGASISKDTLGLLEADSAGVRHS